MPLSVSFLETQGLKWFGEVGCARGLIPRRLLPDVCSYQVFRCVLDEILNLTESVSEGFLPTLSKCVSKCGSEKADHCLPGPAHHLLSLKLLGFSETEDVKYRHARPSH